MECGEFDKRNKDYYKLYSKETYFRNLMNINSSDNNDSSKGKGKIIFDVGAHSGESAKFFNVLFPLATIYSFEPIPKMADKIRQLSLDNHFLNECALSNYDGNEDFHIQDITHLSSLHKVNKMSKHSLGYHKKEKHKTITVDVVRGDTFMREKHISKIDLLKIDVQANEVQTIEGFSDAINKVNTVLVEVSFYDFYENKSSIRLIEEQLPSFELYDIFEISKNPKTLGTDWASIIYKNLNFKD